MVAFLTPDREKDPLIAFVPIRFYILGYRLRDVEISGVFIHARYIELLAIHPELVDEIRDLVIRRPRVGQNHHQPLPSIRGLSHTLEHIYHPNELYFVILDHSDLKIRIGMLGYFFSLYSSDPFQNFCVPKRDPLRGTVIEAVHQSSSYLGSVSQIHAGR
jgi:hypothetical protein